MFTGIIRTLGRVTQVARTAEGARLGVELATLGDEAAYRESICVNGACLTVAERAGAECLFDVVDETLSRTTLGALQVGDRVNIEPALRVGDPLGGHFVLGHVDGIGTIENMRQSGGSSELIVRVPPTILEEVVPKGSVAVDGISLTVAATADQSFACAIVPTTLDETTLGSRRPGDKVNVETDILGKHVLRALRGSAEAGSITLDKLRRAGFA